MRAADIEDLDAVKELWRAWLAESPLPHGGEQVAMDLQCQLFTQVVARVRGGVCLVQPGDAVLLWAGMGGPELHGFGVYVRPELRRTGLGSQLLKAGLAAAKAQGFHRVLVSPYVDNTKSQRWLERAGFSPVQVVMGREV